MSGFIPYDTKAKYKIAFLFLTIENVNYPELWEEYFRGNEDKYTIYVHAKYPDKVTVPWMKSNLIEPVETKWGRITKAYFKLFQEAMKDPENVKFVTISESCLPLRSFDSFYNFLLEDDIRTSYIRFMRLSPYDIKERIQKQPGYKEFMPFIKHYARFCVSLYHLLKLFKKPQKDLDFFNNMDIGDEFFWTILHLQQDVDYVKNFEITYDNWEYVDNQKKQIKNNMKNYYEIIDSGSSTKEEKDNANNKLAELKAEFDNIAKNPWSYKIVTDKDLQYAKNVPSFFWRKFPIGSNILSFYEKPYLIGGNKKERKGRVHKNKKHSRKSTKKRKSKQRKSKNRRTRIRRRA